MNKVLLSAEEICGLLDISRATFYRWKDSDNPPPAVLEGGKGRGRAARYDLEAVREWKRRRDDEGPLRILLNELPAILAGALEQAHAEACLPASPEMRESVYYQRGPYSEFKPEVGRRMAAFASSAWASCIAAIASRARELGISEGGWTEVFTHTAEALPDYDDDEFPWHEIDPDDTGVRVEVDHSLSIPTPEAINRLDKFAAGEEEPEEEAPPKKRRKPTKRKP